jgi:hypothetical protein
VGAASNERIFVAVAAYCEPELGLTVADALARADRPDRLRFGILHQFDEDGRPEIREEAVAPFADDERFRVAVRDHREGKGGCWARHHVQAFWEGEEWTLQVDAHTRFADGWDTELIAMAAGLPSGRPLITGFPPPYFRSAGVDDLDRDRRHPVPSVRVTHWDPEGWIDHPTEVVDHGVGAPVRNRILSGAFVFAPGRWNEDVRQDPGHLFAGEELALTLRSFTHGYDLFQPERVVVWHRANDDEDRKWIFDFPPDAVATRHARAWARLRLLLAGDPRRRLGRYSLGERRTLEDYRVFAGLDCATRTIHPDAEAGIPPDPVTIQA